METIKIWGATIPYNRPSVKKKKVMKVKHLPMLASMPKFLLHVFGTKLATDSSALDTYAYRKEIGKGTVSKYMDDVPTLTPYIAEGADTAVIIAPGGAFCYLERTTEGSKIAGQLNEQGISAFVLEYRLNPYEAPACYLDMQRAVRYVRHHASEYGLDPDKIGTVGFSAGGYVAGAENILLGDAPVTVPDYTPDEVDGESGVPSFTGMIYPVFGFDFNPNMLAVLAGDAFFDEEERPSLKEEYSLPRYAHQATAPIFFAYGTKDFLKGHETFDTALMEAEKPHKTLRIEGAGHGFSTMKKYAFWFDEFVEWIRSTTNGLNEKEGGKDEC